MTTAGMKPHSSHWGAFFGQLINGELKVQPHPNDPLPSLLTANLPGALRHKARVARPMVRRGWLERGPGKDSARGRDEFVELTWDNALDLLANELKRVRDNHGAKSVFGGSYGWSSAGRFHHAQSQVHRFLNSSLGGYVRSVNNYSAGAAMVILPHVLGGYDDVSRRNIGWEDIVTHTDIVLAFGGMAIKNSQVASGGVSQHTEYRHMIDMSARGGQFVLVSPLKSDLPAEINSDWMALRPGTDTALMLALAHTLVSENLHDRAFLASHCEGWPQFESYLFGRGDGQVKDAGWAATITGLSSDSIAGLARRLSGKRVVVVVSHSLQRAEHGEQPVWMGSVLAAILGQHGLPGGGYSYALGAIANYGRKTNAVPIAALPQLTNGVSEFIPVARIADMLLNPGAPFDYNGQRLKYPDVRLVYWAGGNPFHHHQDINRLREAFAAAETVVVHEIAWTATARHADFILPCTMTIERNDIGGAPTDPLLIAMHRLADPYAESRDDYAIFSDLSDRLGCRATFTKGRSTEEWLRHLYRVTQDGMIRKGFSAPDFATFWEQGELTLPQLAHDGGIISAFRHDPIINPLPTPSGKIEIFSETIAGFGYSDCPGHPVWITPVDVPSDQFPLQLVANQPATRLHSQFDYGDHSAAMKHRGREVARLHPADAASRGIREGDIIRLFNERGACLAAATIAENIRAGVVQLPTGAWYDPGNAIGDQPMCVHGNPNVLTRDVGTSSLAQGCCGQLTTVQVERFHGDLPPIRAFDPPAASIIPAGTVRFGPKT